MTGRGTPDTVTTGYSRVVIRAVVLGVFTGVFSLAYLLIVEVLTERSWGDDWQRSGWFSGTASTVLIPAAAGLLIGVAYRAFRLPPRFPGFIDELQGGHVDPRNAKGAIAIAVVSLVGGASLGPEAPLGTAGGAAGTWLARRRSENDESVRQMTFVGMSGAFGGLLSTPIGGPLLAFELEHDQTHEYYYTHLIPGMIAGAVSFGIMWPAIGAPFKGLLEIPGSEFRSWMLLVAVVLGAVAVGAAAIVGKIMAGISRLMRVLDDQPVLRGGIGGAIIGLIGWVQPLTLFSGQTALPTILDDFEQLGLFVVLALALLKAIALGASLGGGFYGGPIFPTFFIGTVLGIAVHIAVPSVPLVLAVGCIMAALGSAIALLPLSMAVLSGIMLQSGLEFFGAIALASATAYALRITLARRTPAGELQRAAA